MGEIVVPQKVRLLLLQPCLVRESFRTLLNLFDDGKYDTLLPGIVRQFGSAYAVVEGNHRAIFSSVIEKPQAFYLPRHSRDFLQEDEFPSVPYEFIEDANRALTLNFMNIERHLPRNRTEYLESTIEFKRDKFGLHTLEDIRAFVNNHSQVLDVFDTRKAMYSVYM